MSIMDNIESEYIERIKALKYLLDTSENVRDKQQARITELETALHLIIKKGMAIEPFPTLWRDMLSEARKALGPQ